nr:adenylate kinase 8 [Megalopta genalis]
MSDELETRIQKINARFVAYLEKHRIYELFHNLATQLIIHEPDDHLVFMKQYMETAAQRLDATKIILIAPPTFDKITVAEIFHGELGIHPFTLKELRRMCEKDNDTCHCVESEDLAFAMRKMLETGAFMRGWVLVDLPRTKKEARIFQRAGIIPTHVIQLIVSNETGKSIYNWDNVCMNDTCYQSCKPFNFMAKSDQRLYEKRLQGLREAYANVLIEVDVGIRNIDELAKDCVKLAKTKKHSGAPALFRIALIGSRGSGCTTLAKYLAERFNLVHVDYDYVAKQCSLQKNPLGEMLRMFEHQWGARSKPEIKMQIVEKYISGYECLKKGWVLTGYPKTVEDFKLLDLSPTPPNRVIFMEVSGDVCRERLLNRRYNMETGSKHDSFTKSNNDTRDIKLAVHPKDYRLIVERDLQEYDENVADMMRYADNWDNVCMNDTCYQSCKPFNFMAKSDQRLYEKRLQGLREAYANVLIEVDVGIRNIDELAKDCVKLAKTKKHSGAPALFRIALIGSRGSGCTTLAKYLAERFNLVHVDYDYVAKQCSLQKNPLGEMLRMFEHQWGARSKPEIKMQIVEKYISGYECLKKGWVLTGYPKTVEDFKLLDLSPTPPNRSVAMSVEKDYSIAATIWRQLQEYDENVADMMRYAGESAVKIDGNEDEKIVREKVEACLMHPAPDQKLRVPRPPPEIDPMDIEFDPDDEPDSSVFDPIRAREPTYVFL